VRKPATPGCEDRVRVLVQAHIDMVCSKTTASSHDFDTDPILADITADGQWVQAEGTTLGADDGVGVAAALALLEAAPESLAHGPLECLFTVEEETTMDGAINLAPAPFIEAQALINVDSEEDHCVCVGCAGGQELKLYLPVQRTGARYTPAAEIAKAHVDSRTPATAAAATGSAAFPVAAASLAADAIVAITADLSGFAGGHTGVDANSARANAIQVLARLLSAAGDAAPGAVELVSYTGGNAPNAIPRDARAVVAVPAAAAAAVADAMASLFAEIITEALLPEAKAKLGEASAGLYGAQSSAAQEAKELAGNPARARELCGMRLDISLAALAPAAAEGTVYEPLTAAATGKVAALVQTVPHGVLRYSPEVAGDVDTSNALAIVELLPTAVAAAAEAAPGDEAATGRHGNCDEAAPAGDIFTIHCFYRSFSDFQLRETTRKLKSIATLAGASTSAAFGYFNGWEPAMASPLLKSVLSSHSELFPTLPAPQVYSVHAGLECGPIKNVYPNLHCVSIGPLSTLHLFQLVFPIS
jgi:dipeptidase D